jgi:hypothetical protein
VAFQACKLTLLHQRVQLDLVNHRRDACFVNQTLQVMNLEITDADAFHQPSFAAQSSLSRLQHNGRWPEPASASDRDRRNRAEAYPGSPARLRGAFLIVIPQFRGDEKVIAGTPALASALPTPSSFLYAAAVSIDR